MKKFGTVKSIVLCFVLVAAISAAGFLYNYTKPGTNPGMKTITVEVVSADGASETFPIETEEEYLGAALMAEKLIEGETSTYGLFIKSANGITADEKKQQWWCITKDGGDVNTGVDATPIADGDKFELTLKTGY